ncbi:MAG: hypothetical protein JWM97_2051 [Phycisphaerales bacterium]|nr:hypothetical protein [Phycisphaerales bacterium]
MSTVSRPPRAGKFPGFRNLSDRDLIDIIGGDHPWVQAHEIDEATEEASAELVRRLERRKPVSFTPVEERLVKTLTPLMRQWLDASEDGAANLGPCGPETPRLMASAAVGIWLAVSDAQTMLAAQGLIAEPQSVA